MLLTDKIIFFNKDFYKKSIRIMKHSLNKGTLRCLRTVFQKTHPLSMTGKPGSDRIPGSVAGTVITNLLAQQFNIPLVIVSGIPGVPDSSSGFIRNTINAIHLLPCDSGLQQSILPTPKHPFFSYLISAVFINLNSPGSACVRTR